MDSVISVTHASSGFADLRDHVVVLTPLWSSGCRSNEGDSPPLPLNFSLYMQPSVVENITLDMVISLFNI